MIRFEFDPVDLSDNGPEFFAHIVLEMKKGDDISILEEIDLFRSYLLARTYPPELIDKYIYNIGNS